MIERTLALIKPDVSTNEKKFLEIEEKIYKAGFKQIVHVSVRLTLNQAKAFYDVHKNKPFFNDLVRFMSSGEVDAFCLEKENAVEDLRRLVGSTNPAEAAEGTIRNLYGNHNVIRKNAIHASDSIESAEKEINFFFAGMDLIPPDETWDSLKEKPEEDWSSLKEETW